MSCDKATSPSKCSDHYTLCNGSGPELLLQMYSKTASGAILCSNCVHCSDKQAISFCESSWQSPAFSTVQLHNALSSDQDWAKQGMLRLCTFTKAWREENSAERKGKWGWEGSVQLAAICYQKWKSSASQSFSVLSFGNKSIIFFIVELKLSSSHSITYPWQGPLGCSPKRCV